MNQTILDFDRPIIHDRPVGLADLIWGSRNIEDVFWYKAVPGLLGKSAERAAMALGIRDNEDFLRIVKTADPADIAFKDLPICAKIAICRHISIQRKSPEFYKIAYSLINSQTRPIVPDEATGYVYWMESFRSRLHKIGFSTKPERRLSDLKVAVPDIKIQEYRKGTEKHEKQIHEILKEYSAGGEWFDTDDGNIAAALDLVLPIP